MNSSTEQEKWYIRFAPVVVLAGCCLAIILAIWFVLAFSTTLAKENVGIYQTVGLTIIVVWMIAILLFYVWAIYYYNISLGYSPWEWQKIRDRIAAAEARRAIGEDVPVEDLKAPDTNPYKSQTFGLPDGTVRGTIALTLLVVAVALFIIAIDKPSIAEGKTFDFFVTGFEMMLAFYFGSRALSVLNAKEETKRVLGTSNGPAPAASASAPVAERGSSEATTAGLPASIPEASEPAPGSPPVPPGATDALGEATATTPLASSLISSFPQIVATENNRSLSRDHVIEAAKGLGIEPAALNAVVAVESGGKGFFSDGRPKILFEGHIFWKQLKANNIDPEPWAVKFPDIVYPSWTKKFYKGGTAEYDRLERAKLIHASAAFKSASWGLFQIMGFNHKNCGYDTVEAYVEAMHVSEREHLDAFCHFASANHMTRALLAKDWAAFARAYNGPGYAKNNYDKKLAAAYARFVNLDWNKDVPVAGIHSDIPDFASLPDNVKRLITQALSMLGEDQTVYDKLSPEYQKLCYGASHLSDPKDLHYKDIVCADLAYICLRAAGVTAEWKVTLPTGTAFNNHHCANYFRPSDILQTITDPNDWKPGDIMVFHNGTDLTKERMRHVNVYVGPFSGPDLNGKFYDRGTADVVNASIDSMNSDHETGTSVLGYKKDLCMQKRLIYEHVIHLRHKEFA